MYNEELDTDTMATLDGLYIGDEAAQVVTDLLNNEVPTWVEQTPALTAGSESYTGPLTIERDYTTGELIFPEGVISDRSVLHQMSLEAGLYPDQETAAKALREAIRYHTAKTPAEVYMAWQHECIRRQVAVDAANVQAQIAR